MECYLAEINAFHLYVNGIIHDIFPLANTCEFCKNVNVMALFSMKFIVYFEHNPYIINYIIMMFYIRSVSVACSRLKPIGLDFRVDPIIW